MDAQAELAEQEEHADIGPAQRTSVGPVTALTGGATPSRRRVAGSEDGAMRSRLVDAGRVLVEAGGVEALSMRKVAADVGVAPTAIYWHVGDRDDLLHGVLDAMILDMPELTAEGSTPRERVGSIARRLREQVLVTSSAQQLARQLGRSAQLFLPAQLAVARELTAAGLGGEEAAAALRAVLFLVGGFILLEDEHRHRKPGATTQELWQAVDDPEVDHDLQEAMSRPVPADALFRYALDRLLASILPD